MDERALLRRIARAERLRAARARGTHTAEEWRALVAQYGGRCARCGAPGRLEPDHVVPIRHGGSDEIGNLQPLCPRCNARKGATL